MEQCNMAIQRGECTEPKRELQIPSELSATHTRVDLLSGRLEKLEARLSPVLRDEPQITNAKGENKECLVPLAHELTIVGEKVSVAVEQIDSILERIEL